MKKTYTAEEVKKIIQTSMMIGERKGWIEHDEENMNHEEFIKMCKDYGIHDTMKDVGYL